MTEEDIVSENRLIDDVLKNFGQQLKIDYKAYERERQQNVYQPNWITSNNSIFMMSNNKRACLSISNQRQEIVERMLGLKIQVKVLQIKNTLKELQNGLAQQCRDLTHVLSPLDTTTVMETLVKLRDATY